MTEKLDIKTMVGGDKKVFFVRFQDEKLFYKTDNGFEFSVPLSDTGGACFNAEEKATLFMRWIRKGISYQEALAAELKSAQEEVAEIKKGFVSFDAEN